MNTRLASALWLACLVACVLPAWALAQIPPHQAAPIRKAAKELTLRVAPQKARTVLIWNTPPHLMDKDPHKGYCIPYGEEALKAMGEATGAFKPVVSDDIAVFTPRHPAIRRDRAEQRLRPVDYADARRHGEGSPEKARGRP